MDKGDPDQLSQVAGTFQSGASPRDPGFLGAQGVSRPEPPCTSGAFILTWARDMARGSPELTCHVGRPRSRHRLTCRRGRLTCERQLLEGAWALV